MKWRITRIRALIGVAAMLVVLALLPAGEESDLARSAKSNSQPQTASLSQPAARKQTPALGRVELERLSQQTPKVEDGKSVPNAFKSTSWYVAPPRKPEPPPPPPPAPTAPPLPFTYLGRYEDPSKLVIMLANGGKLYTVAEGEVIDSTYRIERITRETVDFVYLPLNIKQSLGTLTVPDSNQNRAGSEVQNRRP